MSLLMRLIGIERITFDTKGNMDREVYQKKRYYNVSKTKELDNHCYHDKLTIYFIINSRTMLDKVMDGDADDLTLKEILIALAC